MHLEQSALGATPCIQKQFVNCGQDPMTRAAIGDLDVRPLAGECEIEAVFATLAVPWSGIAPKQIQSINLIIRPRMWICEYCPNEAP